MTVTAFWSLKGGAGTTSVCTAAAIIAARNRSGAGVLLVDLVGDVPAVLGMADRTAPGVAEWMRSADRHDTHDFETRATCSLTVLTRGRGLLGGRPQAARLARVLADDPRDVIIDCGVLGIRDLGEDVTTAGHTLAHRAQATVLVTKACALALDLLRSTPVPITAVIVQRERGRTFGTDQIERLTGAPVIAEVDYDPLIARSIDTGTLARQLPPTLESALDRRAFLLRPHRHPL